MEVRGRRRRKERRQREPISSLSPLFAPASVALPLKHRPPPLPPIPLYINSIPFIIIPCTFHSLVLPHHMHCVWYGNRIFNLAHLFGFGLYLIFPRRPRRPGEGSGFDSEMIDDLSWSPSPSLPPSSSSLPHYTFLYIIII